MIVNIRNYAWKLSSQCVILERVLMYEFFPGCHALVPSINDERVHEVGLGVEVSFVMFVIVHRLFYAFCF